MKIKALSILLAFVFTLLQSQAGEPLRVGIDVPEPKLLKKVEIDYPEEAKIARKDNPNVLKLLINEQGNVEQIKPLLFDRLTIDATIGAVKQWQFAPSYWNKKAVPVTANLLVLFVLDRTPSYLYFDEEPTTGVQAAAIYEGNICCRIAKRSCLASKSRKSGSVVHFQRQRSAQRMWWRPPKTVTSIGPMEREKPGR